MITVYPNPVKLSKQKQTFPGLKTRDIQGVKKTIEVLSIKTIENLKSDYNQ
jgi:hypothetical protein